MGFGVEFPGTGYGMKAEYESSNSYGGSMQMMRPQPHMHTENYHAHTHGGPHGQNMHHSSVGYSHSTTPAYGYDSHSSYGSSGYDSHGSYGSSGYVKPVGMHGCGPNGMPRTGHQSYHIQNAGPGHMTDMNYDQDNFDNGFARGYNYDGSFKTQSGGYGAEYRKKGI